MHIFEQLESRVRSYSRSFPAVFATGQGPWLTDVNGRRYLDWFCGAGALNYGHNEPGMKQALIDYLQSDGVLHSLDMATRAKAHFLERFRDVILRPRGLDYRVQFTGPTGANAVEAALKIARKVTRRSNVIAFTRAYHGLSQGALAATANARYRDEAYVQRGGVTFLPYDGYMGPHLDTMDYVERVLTDRSSGIDAPAAILIETVQAEGGVHPASTSWLRRLEALARQQRLLLIVDDIQTGCGRTGSFFSFEDAGLRPDIVLLSKSISGYGLPMSIALLAPEIDQQWTPGEHTGTFRGNNAAFVTAAEALRFWETPDLMMRVARLSEKIRATLGTFARASNLGIEVRGRGLIIGFETSDPMVNGRIARQCFEQGLMLETCGGERNVVKLLPPLTMADEVLDQGLEMFATAFEAAVVADAVSS